MITELGFTSDEGRIRPEQIRLEAEAQARVDSAERMVEDTTITITPRISENVFTPIVATISYRRALNWLSRVESVRDLQLVSPSTPEVIFGSLASGQKIFLSSQRNSLGFRRKVYGVVGGDQLKEREARKLLRQYSSPLRKREQLMYRGS